MIYLSGLSATPEPEGIPSPPPQLDPKATLDPNSFQQKWYQLSTSLTQEHSLSPQGVAALQTPQALLQHMQSHCFHCIASGGQSPNLKFFFFAQKTEVIELSCEMYHKHIICQSSNKDQN